MPAYARRQAIVGISVAFGGLALGPARAWAQTEQELSRTAESIHQETVFKATRKRVYEALTVADPFGQVEQRSAAMSGTAAGKAPSQIGRQAGESFSLFGGYIVGRHVELLPSERIVQAWRVVGWEPGVYSIARFERVEQGADTKLVFDHTGFPKGQGEHLASGWKANYWEPLARFLA